MTFGLTAETIRKIHSVFSNFPSVEKVAIYGSGANESYRNDSDIDLTLYGDERLTRQALNNITHKLGDLLLPSNIDLSIFSNITDSDLIEQIRRVGTTFYE